jgi:perosamine synthetase
MDRIIQTAGPSISQKEIDYVLDAVKNGWYENWNGYIKKFEAGFAEYIGAKHAISTSSCTGALHLSLAGLGIKKGDEVLVPDSRCHLCGSPTDLRGC